VRRGVVSEVESARRLSAVGLYVAFVPLAALVELADGAWQRHPAVLLTATVFLVLQMVAVWVVRPMPMRGWATLVVSVPAAYVLYAYASPAAGQMLSIVLIVPIGWTATFLTARYVALSVALNTLAVGTLLGFGSSGERWLVFVVRSLTFTVVAVAAHTVVSSLRHAQRAAEVRADTDAVTGVLSRARMLDLLAPILGLHDPPSLDVGLVIADIDHFKRVNDSYGHLAGDEALRGVASTLQAILREDDLLARWGGEEFLIAARGISDHAALSSLAEKLRLAVAHANIRLDGCHVPMTISLGAVMVEPHASVRALITAADDALYQAKHEGRNRVRLARPRLSHIQVPRTPTDLATIRRRVREAAYKAGLSEERITDITLAASEVCAHLLRHGTSTPSRVLELTTHDREHQFTVAIHDHHSIQLPPPE
jgi:diguanylate cyclase (GGDEF)-like protein